MTDYYQNVYASLRGAMIDRDAGDKTEDAVMVDFISAKVALKEHIPSSALLIAYSMLYYPGWLDTGDEDILPIGRPVENFAGGVENSAFPLLFNIHMTMIAVAVGIYAKLWTIQYSHVMGTILIYPNMNNPLVQETQRRIRSERLSFSHAREVFIELMQREEYALEVPLADDYIANANFIIEAEASVDMTDDVKEYTEKINQVVDPAYFRGDN